MGQYRRVLLKLSGESLGGPSGKGISEDVLAAYAQEIAQAVRGGLQVSIVIGGGNIFRGLSGVGKGFDRVGGDRMGMLDTMRKATRLDGVAACPDYYEGATGFLRKEGQVEDFMDNLDRRSTPRKVQDIYALIAFLASAAIAAVALVLGGSVATFFQVWAVTLLAAAPASAFVIFSRPAAILQRRLHRLGTVICGWQGIVGLSGKAVFPLTHKDLFPGNMVKMNGVKFFGHRDPDEIVAYSTALMVAADSALAPLFTQVLDSNL